MLKVWPEGLCLFGLFYIRPFLKPDDKQNRLSNTITKFKVTFSCIPDAPVVNYFFKKASLPPIWLYSGSNC